MKMLLLLAKPKSGADCLHCLAGRLSFQSQGARRSHTVARWAPGSQHASVCLPSSAKEKNFIIKNTVKRWIEIHFIDLGFDVLVFAFAALLLLRYADTPVKYSPHPPLII